MRWKMYAGLGVVCFPKTETWITKRPAAVEDKRLIKWRMERQSPSATRQPPISISANTGFLFRYHHQRDPGSMPLPDDERIFFQSRRVRWSILVAYWAVILLALPLWWTTTSIQRLSLPTSRVEDLVQKNLRFPLDIALDSSSGADTKALSPKLQNLINARLSPDVRAWLDVHVHPDPIPREFPVMYHTPSKPQQKSNTGADAYVVKFDTSSQGSKVQGRNLVLAGDGCLWKFFNQIARSHTHLQPHPLCWQICLSTYWCPDILRPTNKGLPNTPRVTGLRFHS